MSHTLYFQLSHTNNLSLYPSLAGPRLARPVSGVVAQRQLFGGLVRVVELRERRYQEDLRAYARVPQLVYLRHGLLSSKRADKRGRNY